MNLSSSITVLGSFSRSLAKPLKNLGIETMHDLIFYFPYRYDDLSKIVNIRDILSGEVVTVKGKIQFIRNFRSPVKHKLITEALVADSSGSIRAIWFNQAYLVKIIRAGEEVFLSGEASWDRTGLVFSNPNYELVRERTLHTGRIVPIYSVTSNITEKQIRAVVHSALRDVEFVTDWIPEVLLKKYNLLPLADALINIHFPSSNEALLAAERRLKFNELFILQVANSLLKSELVNAPAIPLEFHEMDTKKFVESLPFKLTKAQRSAAWEILKDLGKSQPMQRLLNGDVGSGKTVVAAIAILNAAYNSGQSAYLAPTEILAIQHFHTLSKMLVPFGIRVALLSSNHYKKANPRLNPLPWRKAGEVGVGPALAGQKGDGEEILLKKVELKKQIKAGDIDLVIGTHAILEKDVIFKNLVLTVIDEQHRFGVHQRQLLRSKHRDPKNPNTSELSEKDLGSFGSNSDHSDRVPHFLSMTATPIPRTLALTIYGDLDLSILDEMPPGRKQIETKLVSKTEIARVYAFIKNEIDKGRQVFCISPLIDPSDILEVRSVKEMKEQLESKIFPSSRIATLHGKMRPADKEKVMRDFLDRKFDILVSTSVVEVGVDVPNATVMMIEGAERFGLAQLHQFRGRVGRGEQQSYCFLFSEALSDRATLRLRTIETLHNGFELAEKDLEFRGIGELFGTQQWGRVESRFLDFSDLELIKICREAAVELISKDQALTTWPALKSKVEEFIKEVHPE